MPRIWSSVDLPAPDGPMIEMNSPSLMSSVIRRKTHVRLVPCAYDFSRPRSEMSASVAIGSRLAAGEAGEDREKRAMVHNSNSPFTDPPPLLAGTDTTGGTPPRIVEKQAGSKTHGTLGKVARWCRRRRSDRLGSGWK